MIRGAIGRVKQRKHKTIRGQDNIREQKEASQGKQSNLLINFARSFDLKLDEHAPTGLVLTVVIPYSLSLSLSLSLSSDHYPRFLLTNKRITGVEVHGKENEGDIK